ncbi:MAG: outer membrane lipoprotein carrier protein LolA [Betaproteobacteria bacterium]|nr:outer membrane lipoprotein carrier protein LolA [Betaproteobacteria bacterium]
MSKRRWIRALLACAVLCTASVVRADGLGDLENFLRSVRSGRAEFTQVVTPPAREGQAARSKTSSGSFEFQRPDRFRFQYRKPFEQVLVADGQTLWLHDVDLNQVSARAQAQALASTPVALLSGASDLSALRRDFTLNAAPESGGLQWAEAVPRVKDGTLRRVRIGFRDGALAALEIDDSFGQRSVLSFSALQTNVPIAADRLKFVPPAGADVVRQ